MIEAHDFSVDTAKMATLWRELPCLRQAGKETSLSKRPGH